MSPATDSALDRACHDRPTDRSNQLRILAWMVVWMGTWLAANYAASRDVLTGTVPGVVAAGVTALLGVGTLFAYHRFLRETDELRRKIELEALAFAFGVGLVGSLSAWLLERTGVVAEADMMLVWSAALVTYSLAVFVGLWRYSR